MQENGDKDWLLELAPVYLHVSAREMAALLSEEASSVSTSQSGHILCPLVWVRVTQNRRGKGGDKTFNAYAWIFQNAVTSFIPLRTIAWANSYRKSF